jgi:hypothetical protein
VGLLQALDNAPWPSVPDDEVLVLRRIEVRGTAREIIAKAAQRASILAAEAVWPDDPRAAQAPAVRFRSRPALKARLMLDLASGQAAALWYWQEWRPLFHRPLASALVQLFEAEILDLPAVLLALRQQPLWSDWWRILDEPAAQRLWVAFSAVLGLGHAIDVASRAPDPTTPLDSTIMALARQPMAWLPPLPAGLPARSHRVRLAALLRLLQWAPAMLRQSDASQTLHALRLALTGTLPTMVDMPVAAPHPTPATTSAAVLATAEPRLTRRTPAPAQREADAKQPASLLDRSSAPAPTMSESLDEGGARLVVPAVTFAANSAASDTRHDEGLITAQGGAFYLLNFLALSSVQDKLYGRDLPGVGWRWLLGLMRAFGAEPDAALAQFMAIECGLTQGSELALLPPLPPGPQAQELLAQARRRYGEEAVQASFGLLPARILHSPTHVDVHLRMNDIHLPVRRVGLDVNPGWLPWLGRVVTFRYGSGREPGMAWQP